MRWAVQHTSYAKPIVLLAATAALQAEESVLNLDPTIVTDTRLEDSVGEDEGGEALKPEVVSAEDLQESLATDLEDIFQKTPSVNVNGGRAQAQQIFVNGLETSLSNVTIDGASQGNMFHHSSAVFVEPELLKQVGVNAGAGNALQGLGALNGSVEFETINAFDFLSDGRQFGGLSKGTYYVNGDGYRVSQTLASRLGDNWGVLLSGGYLDRDDYEDGNGNTVDLTEYTSKNALLKLSGLFDNGQSLDLGFEHVHQETLAYSRLNVDGAWLDASGRPKGDLQQTNLGRSTLSANYTLNPEDNDFLNFRTNVYYTRQELERELTDEFSHLDTVGGTIRNESQLFEGLVSTYGFDFRRSENDVELSWIPGIKADEEETAYGFFLQSDWTPHRMVTFSAGARYDFYDYTDIEGNEFDSSQLSPNASITVRPVEGLSVTGSYAQAYRGVGIREAFIPSVLDEATSGPFNPEEAETYKIEAVYERNGFFAKGAYFNQTIDNYLYPIAGNGSFGDIKNEGYEFYVGYRKGGFTVSGGVADSDPEVEGYAYPDDLGVVVAGRRWIGEVRYAHEGTGLTGGASIEHREEVEEVPLGSFPAVAGKDAYTLVNAFLRWDIERVEGLALTANVDNIFDEHYQAHTIFTDSGLQSPGRQFRFGAEFEF